MNAHNPLFSELVAEDIDFIASHGVIRVYQKNVILITEGEEHDSLHVMIEGRVKTYVSGRNGKEAILSIQGPGEFFGELSMIDEVPRSASVITLEPSRIAFVTRAGFERCIVENSTLAIKLIRSLTHRVRCLTEAFKNLALNDVYGRVAHTLLRLACEKDGQLVVKPRPTHQDLANMVAASREMVSRIMKDLTIGGYILVKDKTITIQTTLPPAW